MASQGPKNCGTGADNGGGGTAWSTPNGIASSGSNANCPNIPALGGSDFLVAKNFGFSIPPGSTINGIQFSVIRLNDAGGQVVDAGIQLTKDGTTRVGADRSSATAWPASATTITYGSTSDLWATTWSPSDINASTFGISITVTNNDSINTHNAQVNAFVTCTVTYTPPPLEIIVADFFNF